MSIFLIILPILTFLVSMALYKFVGMRQLMKLDLVQFIYTFFVAPAFFVWMKAMVYFLLKQELGVSLTTAEFLVFDTFFSVLFLYLFAFVVMHSVTSSFNLMVADDDPLYDIFSHSEYIHLWLSHIGLVVGAMLVTVALAAINIWFVLPNFSVEVPWWVVATGGLVLGIGMYLGVLDTDPQQSGTHYMRMMKLAFGMFFLVLATLGLIQQVPLQSAHAFYWFMLTAYATATALSFFTYRSLRARTVIQKMADSFKRPSWNFRLQVFGSNTSTIKNESTEKIL